MSKKTIEQSNEGAHPIQPRQFGLFNRIKILPPAELKKILGAFTDEVQKCIASGNDDLRDLFEVVVSRRLQSFAAETVQSVREIGSKTNAEIEEILQAETAKLVKAAAMSSERFEEMFGEIQAQILDLQFMPDELKEYLQNTQADLENSIKQSESEIVSKIEQAEERIKAHTTRTVNSALTKQQSQRLKSLKDRLQREVNADNIDEDEIKAVCHDVLVIDKDDCLARFYLLTCRNDRSQIREFIGNIDIDRDYDSIESIVEYAVERLDIDIITLKALETLITMAYERRDTGKYGKWTAIIGKEKLNLDNEVYDPYKERDCFIAYSGSQLEIAEQLAEYLQSQGIECFIAAHNIRHNTRSDYESKLKTAIENCKVFVLISSDVSRQTRDIRNIEIKHVMDLDYGNAPPEYRAQRNYAGIPYRLKKPRLEYIIEPYGGKTYEQMIDVFFRGYDNKVYVDNNDPESAMREVAEYIWAVKDGIDLDPEPNSGDNNAAAQDIPEPPKAVEQPKAQPPKQPKKPEPSKPKTSAVITKPVEPKQPKKPEPPKPKTVDVIAKPVEPKQQDYPTLSNYDKNEFKIKGTTLVEYKGKGCEVKIPMGIKEIGKEAFQYCRSLTSIEIPSSVTSIGKSAFRECSSLTSIEIPNSVTSIGECAFNGCKSLTSIEIPKCVRSIGYGVFSDCSSLESIVVESGNTKYHICEGCLIKISSKTLIAGCKNSVIPKDGSVREIGKWAFSGCKSLTSIEIPSSVRSIGDRAFSNCSSLESIVVVGINPKYHSSGNCLIEIATKTLIAGCKNSVIPKDGSVKKIRDRAFRGCSGLTSIEIPNSVRSIGDSAFHGCESLISIKIPGSVTSIGEWAFRGCSSLTSIKIPKGVRSIGWMAFRGCSSLTSIKIPKGVRSIGWMAFDGCSSLTSIEIPNSVTSIGEWAFNGCSGLTSIEIPNSVRSIGWMAFDGCSSLTSIEIPNSVTSIGSWAFWGCSSLTRVKMPRRFEHERYDIFGDRYKEIEFTFTE